MGNGVSEGGQAVLRSLEAIEQYNGISYNGALTQVIQVGHRFLHE